MQASSNRTGQEKEYSLDSLKKVSLDDGTYLKDYVNTSTLIFQFKEMPSEPHPSNNSIPSEPHPSNNSIPSEPHPSNNSIPSEPHPSNNSIPSEPHPSNNSIPSEPHPSNNSIPSEPHPSNNSIPSEPHPSNISEPKMSNDLAALVFGGVSVFVVPGLAIAILLTRRLSSPEENPNNDATPDEMEMVQRSIPKHQDASNYFEGTNNETNA